MSGEVKFLADANLGRLVKWLRILGYDTVSYSGPADRAFLRHAQKEGRVVLTRVRTMAKRQYSGRLVIVYSERVQDQLREVFDALSLTVDPERVLSLCLKCNEKLIEVTREDVAGLVPEYIFLTHSEMFQCPRCGGIFWPGSHVENVQRIIERIPSHHP